MPFDLGQLGAVFAPAKGAFQCASAAGTVDGQPSQMFLKDLIRVGRYINPVDGRAFEVTHADLEHWALTFSAMDTAGVRVPVPEGHTTEAKMNRGYVRGMFRDGDVLRGKIELIGTDAITLAARNDVSVYVPPQFFDGKGTKYENPITHVAITSYPVVSGLRPFVPIAASLGGKVEQVPVLRLAEPGASTMDALKKIAAAMGLTVADDMDEAALTEAILTACKGTTEAMSAAKTEAEKSKAALAASLAEKSKPADPMVLKLSGENRKMKIDRLVSAGKLTPAAAKALSAQYAEGDGLALSLNPAEDARFDTVLAVIEANDPIVLAKAATANAIALSRVTPGGEQSIAVDPKEIEASAASVYGRPVPK